MTTYCSDCGSSCPALERPGWRYGLILGGAVGLATSQPQGVVTSALAGALAGHLVDLHLLPGCPRCRDRIVELEPRPR